MSNTFREFPGNANKIDIIIQFFGCLNNKELVGSIVYSLKFHIGLPVHSYDSHQDKLTSERQNVGAEFIY